MQSKLRVLEASEGAEFDRMYADDFGIDAHRSAIRVFRNQVARGSDPDVLAFAERGLPMLQRHLQVAQKLTRPTLLRTLQMAQYHQACPAPHTAGGTDPGGCSGCAALPARPAAGS